MSHELEIRDGLASFVSYREPAWHRLGHVVTEAMTSAEALALSRADYEVSTMPLFAFDGSRAVPVGDKVATTRMVGERPQVLGVVGTGYEVVQNKDAFGLLDDIAGVGGATFETAGVLRDGSRVFATMKLPETVTVAGVDRHDLYVSVATSHDGSLALTAMVTPVRVVCQNTLSVAIGTAERVHRIRHTCSAPARMTEAKKVLGVADRYAAAFAAHADRLTGLRLGRFDADAMLAELWPDEGAEATKARRAEARSMVLGIYDCSATVSDFAGTGWGFLQSVSEFVEHVAIPRGGDAGVVRRAEGMLFGDGASARILAKAAGLVGAMV